MKPEEFDMLTIPASDAAEAIGVNIRTVQLWLKSEEVEGYQTITGRWMVAVGSLRQHVRKLAARRRDGGRTEARLNQWLEQHHGGKVA